MVATSTQPGLQVVSRRSYQQQSRMGTNLIVDNPELAAALFCLHLPTSKGRKTELAQQREEIGKSAGVISKENQTRVARMVAQWFTHYAASAYYCIFYLMDNLPSIVMRKLHFIHQLNVTLARGLFFPADQYFSQFKQGRLIRRKYFS